MSLDFVQDSFGNHVGIALFGSRSKELRFESTVCVEHAPSDPASLDHVDAAMTFPATYSEDELPELAPYIARQTPDPEDAVGNWARQFLPASGTIGTFELLFRLSQGINQGFSYRRREAKGIQQPVETLRLGHGSCRDFALLMIEAARALGLAARFASGYLALPLDEPDRAAKRLCPRIDPCLGADLSAARGLDRFRPDQRQRREARALSPSRWCMIRSMRFPSTAPSWDASRTISGWRCR